MTPTTFRGILTRCLLKGLFVWSLIAFPLTGSVIGEGMRW